MFYLTMHSIKYQYLFNLERLQNSPPPPPPPMNVLKRGFFYGAYFEKWGMVFWGESNKEEIYFFY